MTDKLIQDEEQVTIQVLLSEIVALRQERADLAERTKHILKLLIELRSEVHAFF